MFANHLSGEIRYALQDHRNSEWQNKLQQFDDAVSTWKLKRNLGLRQCQTISLRGMAYSYTNKAEVFAEHLENSFQPRYDNLNIVHVRRVCCQVADALTTYDEDVLPTVTTSTDRTYIKTLKPIEKAPGSDEIPATTLRCVIRKPLVALTNIINVSLRLRIYTSQ